MFSQWLQYWHISHTTYLLACSTFLLHSQMFSFYPTYIYIYIYCDHKAICTHNVYKFRRRIKQPHAIYGLTIPCEIFCLQSTWLPLLSPLSLCVRYTLLFLFSTYSGMVGCTRRIHGPLSTGQGWTSGVPFLQCWECRCLILGMKVTHIHYALPYRGYISLGNNFMKFVKMKALQNLLPMKFGLELACPWCMTSMRTLMYT